MKEHILVIAAHSDDQILGAGATMAEYAHEGHTIKTIILSQGEKSHPHLQADVITKIRQKESHQADEVIGGDGVLFLDFKEGQFPQHYPLHEHGLRQFIQNFKPTKIFTHSVDDGHPDHINTHKIVIELYDRLKLRCDLYTFDVWTPFNLKKRENPWLFVDVSKTFPKKMAALRCFKSQYLAASYPIILSYLRAIYHGFFNNTSYAEIFYKVR